VSSVAIVLDGGESFTSVRCPLLLFLFWITDLGHLPALGLVNFQRKHWLGVMHRVSTFVVVSMILSLCHLIQHTAWSQIDARRFLGWLDEMK
jgi:hypothetical protein